MDQARMKQYFEAVSNKEANENFSELRKKLGLIVGGASYSEICCLKNEKTGERYYTCIKK